MKYIIFFILCLSFIHSQELSLDSPGPSNIIKLTKKEKEFIKKHPDILLGIDATWAPYVIVENGKITGGYDFELIKKINKLANINIRLVPGVWSRLVDQAKTAKIHGLATSVYSKEREKYFLFTDPVLIIRNNIVVKEGNPENIQSIEDLKGKSIAIQKDNGFQINRLKKIKNAKIVEFKDYGNLPSFLETHNIDAIPMSDASLYTLNSLNTPFRKILYLEDDKKTEIVCSINKRYPELASIINKVLALIPVEEMEQLRKKWLFSPIIYEEKKTTAVKLTEKELLFLKKRPRIVLGIAKDSTKESGLLNKNRINRYILNLSNLIYELSGLRIDFKLIPKSRLMEDIESNKIDGFIANPQEYNKNNSFLTSDQYRFNDNPPIVYVFRKNYEEAILIINKALKEISLNKSYLTDLNFERTAYKELDFLTEEEKEYLYTKKKITFCADPAWPPFETIKNGKYEGIGADILDTLSELLNIPFEYIHTDTWNKSLDFIKKERCDILPLVMETKTKAEYMNFTEPLFSYKLVVVTKNNVSFIDRVEELKNRKVGIPENYAAAELLKEKYPYLKIISVENNADGLEKVVRGELFAFIGTVPGIGHLIQEEFLGEVKITGSIDEKLLLSIGAAKSQKLLISILDKAAKKITEESKQKITKRWVSFIYEDNLAYLKILKIVFFILTFLFIILVFFIYRQYLLKKINKDLGIAFEEERKKNEIQLGQMIQQSRFAQMGEMTNIIAHQWRQPLSAISSTAHNLTFKLLMEEKVDKKSFLNEIELIESYSQHLSKTINDFRSFLTADKKLETVNINQIIDEVIKIIKPTLKTSNIILQTEYENDAYAPVYKNELKQVFLNIIENAKDAITEKNKAHGKIRIKTYREGKEVIVKISDNGGGIPEKIIGKIFEANFTTKTRKGGSGIGLYISKTIVESHFQGSIKAENENSGTAIYISFPAFQDQV